MRISMDYGETLVIYLPDGTQQYFTPSSPNIVKAFTMKDIEDRGIIHKLWEDLQKKYFPFATDDLTTEFLYPALVSMCDNKRIEAIKNIKNFTGWGLKESKDCSDYIQKRLQELIHGNNP